MTMEQTDTARRAAPAAPGAQRWPARPDLRAAVWPVLLAALGAALGCWGLALCVYWPVSFAVWGARALPVANAVLALGLVLAAAGGAALAGGAVALGGAGRPRAAPDSVRSAAPRPGEVLAPGVS